MEEEEDEEEEEKVAPEKVTAPVAVAATPNSVAVLLVGGLRDFDDPTATNMATHVVSPLADEAERTEVFACNEPGENLTPSALKILSNTGANVTQLESWDIQVQESDAWGHWAFLWAVRLRKCYQESVSQKGALAFYLRIRPDLVWDGNIQALSSWPANGISARSYRYAGPRPFVRANQVPPNSANPCNADLNQPSGMQCKSVLKDGGECMVVSDQVFAVPRSLADTVFDYPISAWHDHSDAQNWCDAPPMHRLIGFGTPADAACPNSDQFPEFHFSGYLGAKGVGVDLLYAPARLKKRMAVDWDTFWDTFVAGSKFDVNKALDCSLGQLGAPEPEDLSDLLGSAAEGEVHRDGLALARTAPTRRQDS